MKKYKWYIIWRVICLVFFILLCYYAFDNPSEDFGNDLAYLCIYGGLIPSIILLIIAIRSPLLSIKCAIIYGSLLGLTALCTYLIAANGLWLLFAFPFFGFVLESIYLYFRLFIMKKKF